MTKEKLKLSGSMKTINFYEMKTPNHTPLPWKHCEVSNGFTRTHQVSFENSFKSKTIADCGPIEFVNHNDKNDIKISIENEANAAFIVRACNNHYKLIRACEMALETIKHAALEEFNIPQKLLEEALKQAKVEQ